MNAATPTISTDVAAASRVVDAPADVVELARAAARQDAGGSGLVGTFVDAVSEDDVALTLRFATTEVAYTGWTWCVTVALVDPSQPTISEVVLLPGPDSLLPPPWLPWNERIRPGDLGPGDLLLAPAEDDPRLVPAYVESDDLAVEDVAHELGIGRVRVMSRPGRVDTAERWHDGAFGPTADMAKQAPLHCVMCAFFLPLAGSLGAQFGACGNEMSPADGRIVDLGYGCGAHSENVIEPVPTGFRPSHIDDTVLDVHPRAVAGGLADGAAAFLGEDDSELEVRPTRESAGIEEGPAGDLAVAEAVASDDVAAEPDVAVEPDVAAEPDAAAEPDVDGSRMIDPAVPFENAGGDAVLDGSAVFDEVVADEVAGAGTVFGEDAADPVTDETEAVEPAVDEPVAAEPAAVEPTVADVAVAEPVAGELSTDEPVADEPAVDEPVADELSTDEPVVGESDTAEQAPDGESTPGDADV